MPFAPCCALVNGKFVYTELFKWENLIKVSYDLHISSYQNKQKPTHASANMSFLGSYSEFWFTRLITKLKSWQMADLLFVILPLPYFWNFQLQSICSNSQLVSAWSTFPSPFHDSSVMYKGTPFRSSIKPDSPHILCLAYCGIPLTWVL